MAEANPFIFRRAVVALSGDTVDNACVRLAIETARHGHGGNAEIVGVHVIQVAWSMALDVDNASEYDKSQYILDAADQSVDNAHLKMRTVLVQSRDAGAAIVDEAFACDADLIIVGLPVRRWTSSDESVGHVAAYVLRHAQCAVWVVREPIAAGEPIAVGRPAGLASL
jgi:nucleotide-binding universal stress UspA family protein